MGTVDQSYSRSAHFCNRNYTYLIEMSALRVVSFVLCLLQLTHAQSKCPSPNGYFADSSRCDKYVECREGVAEDKICPDGLLFNVEAAPFRVGSDAGDCGRYVNCQRKGIFVRMPHRTCLASDFLALWLARQCRLLWFWKVPWLHLPRPRYRWWSTFRGRHSTSQSKRLRSLLCVHCW